MGWSKGCHHHHWGGHFFYAAIDMPHRLAAAIAVIALLCAVVVMARNTWIEGTGAYAVVMERVASDPDVGALLGRPIRRGFWVRTAHDEHLTLHVPLRGDKARGTLSLVSDVDGLSIESMVLTSDEQALDLFARDAVAHQHRSARAAWVRGVTFMEQGRHAEAIVALSQAIEAVDTMAQAWFLRGKARMTLGALALAEADLLKATRLDPSEPEPYFLLGALYTQRGQYAECVTVYTTVLGLDSENGSAWHRRAVCYDEQRDHRRALAGAREACSMEVAEGCQLEARLRR